MIKESQFFADDHSHLPVIEVELPVGDVDNEDNVIVHPEVPLQVNDDFIVCNDIPGAPPNTEDPRSEHLEAVKEEEESEDSIWNWKKHPSLVHWIKERYNGVPKHNGYSPVGLERASAYLERLLSEISKAMRADLDGKLNADDIEKIRSEIEKGLDMLADRHDKVKSSKQKPKKKKSYEEFNGFIKEAQKIQGVKGVFVTVPLLISRLARICINGMVSAGHDIESTFEDMSKKYKLTTREKAELTELLESMGYQVRMDRGLDPTEDDQDATSSDNYDWQANYGA